jgi:hypothetical protein
LAWDDFLTFLQTIRRKKMKRFLLVLGVLALFVTAMACTKQEEPAAPATETPAAETETTMPEAVEEAGEAVVEEGQAVTEEAQEAVDEMANEAGEEVEAETPAAE